MDISHAYKYTQHTQTHNTLKHNHTYTLTYKPHNLTFHTYSHTTSDIYHTHIHTTLIHMHTHTSTFKHAHIPNSKKRKDYQSASQWTYLFCSTVLLCFMSYDFYTTAMLLLVPVVSPKQGVRYFLLGYWLGKS